MTRASSSDHLDLDALADVLAGERADDRHLRACPSCADRLAELQAAEVAVAASLATLPAPALPAGLSDRLAEALRMEGLRVEAARTETGRPETGRTETGRTETGRTGPGRTEAARPDPIASLRSAPPLRRRRRPAWVQPVAASVVLALVVALGASLVRLGAGQGGSEDTATTASGGTGGVAELAARLSGTGTDYADEAQRRVVVPALLSTGGASAGSAPDRTTTDTSADADSATEEFAGDEAAPQASRSAPALAGTPPAPAPALSGPAAPDPVLDRLRDPAALAECLTALRLDGSPDTAPLALDYAAYDGAPALAVLQPDADPATLVLTVVGPGCSGADPDTRLRTRVDRP